MIKAQSLLYAIYVCLLVSIVCGGLVYFFSIHTQLNAYYNTLEYNLIYNQSVVNYALNNNCIEEFSPQDEYIQAEISSRDHGLFKILIVKTVFKNDTVTSTHMVGDKNLHKTGLYLSSMSKPLTYAGNVKLFGTTYLPSKKIESKIIDNNFNQIEQSGQLMVSDFLKSNSLELKNIVEGYMRESRQHCEPLTFQSKNNSFINKTSYLNVSKINSRMQFNGNVVIHAADTVKIEQGASLEDVIVSAPNIIIEKGFKGTLQALATNNILVKDSVTLEYPSALVMVSEGQNSNIDIHENVSIKGAIILAGASIQSVKMNKINISKNCKVLGDIYCDGVVELKSDIWGSVYTNGTSHTSPSGHYENLLCGIEINPFQKPKYFVNVPIGKNRRFNGLVKKIY